MSPGSRLARVLLFALLSTAPAFAQDGFEQGVEAYRRGDYARASERWSALLAQDLSALDRARVYYDLGNAAWRQEKPYQAIACYTAAVRFDSRHGDAWRNLEFARAKAGLAPADAGDLGATLRRALESLRPEERRTLLFSALVAWSLLLVLEMHFGGRPWRVTLWLGGAGVLLAALPWAFGELAPRRTAPMLVVDSGNVALRSEPMDAQSPIGELSVLEEVERIDRLPGWVRVERADGQRGWVRAEALFELFLGPAQS